MNIDNELKRRFLEKAIEEYEFSWASEYDKRSMTSRAISEGTLDLDCNNADRDVEVSTDGAWVNARVWVPKGWLDSN